MMIREHHSYEQTGKADNTTTCIGHQLYNERVQSSLEYTYSNADGVMVHGLEIDGMRWVQMYWTLREYEIEKQKEPWHLKTNKRVNKNQKETKDATLEWTQTGLLT